MAVKKQSKQKQVMIADLLCLLVACIWGSGFIASQLAIDSKLSASLIMTLRFTIAAAVMFLCCIPKLKGFTRHELLSGFVAGLFLCSAFFTQTLGQQRTTISHCAFLTATNVVMVPFIMWAINRRRPPLRNFLITAATLAGISILSIAPGSFELSFNLGDVLCLLCALLFALHISCMEWALKDSDVMRVNLIQLATAAVISTAVFLTTDQNTAVSADFSKGLPAVLFLGVFSTCLCYFLQTVAQKYTTPAQAGVLLSTEGLFGTMLSVILGMEALSLNMVVGGLIILLSVILQEFLSAKAAAKKQDACTV